MYLQMLHVTWVELHVMEDGLMSGLEGKVV